MEYIDFCYKCSMSSWVGSDIAVVIEIQHNKGCPGFLLFISFPNSYNGYQPHLYLINTEVAQNTPEDNIGDGYWSKKCTDPITEQLLKRFYSH